MGLFTSHDIPSGTHIVFFVGELLMDPAEIIRRSAQSERGGYMLSFATKTVALDCYKSSSRGHCLASMSNCPYECYNPHSNRPAFDNARLTYKAWGKALVKYIQVLVMCHVTQKISNSNHASEIHQGRLHSCPRRIRSSLNFSKACRKQLIALRCVLKLNPLIIFFLLNNQIWRWDARPVW
jgi:hypothetical protein